MKFSDVPNKGRFYYVGPRPPEEWDDARGVWERCEVHRTLSFISDGVYSCENNARKITGALAGASSDFNDNDLIRAVESEDLAEAGAQLSEVK